MGCSHEWVKTLAKSGMYFLSLCPKCMATKAYIGENETPQNEPQKNKDGRINFGMYFIDEKNGWGYQVIDTIEKETLKRAHGFKTFQESRKAGFEEAKRIIDEIEGINHEKTRTGKN